ncbi:MAG: type 1 glutamine amidotransferase [Pseudomonadota bacterium]
MIVGILETGEVSSPLGARFGSYPEMFEAMFERVSVDFDFFTVSIVSGEFPQAPEDANGWLVTGSRHGVYDSLPWIAPLEAFLREAIAARVPVVGICFGHQILAQALGGSARKWEGGWNLGVQEYRLQARPAWLHGVPDTFSLNAVHQDQVVSLPEDAHCLAVSDGCAVSAVAYGPIETPYAVSVQPHPEFSTTYVGALLEARAGSVFPPQDVEEARQTLDQQVESEAWARALAAYFRRANAARLASTLDALRG